jgi:hypothetical protein
MIDSQLTQSISFGYSIAYPFPHTVIDNFVVDGVKLRQSANEMGKYQYWGYDPSKYSEGNQVNKFFTPWCEDNIQDIKLYAPATYEILSFLNSDTTLRFLEDLTGIKGLIPDPNFIGGGVHKIMREGKLSIHADYNIHPDTGLHRRINLLLYLNENWDKSWGGNLELWDKDLKNCVKSIPPVFNRAVIFNITDDAFHGHPEPLACPSEESRISLALYYFTKDRPDDEKSSQHAAIWKHPEKNEDKDPDKNIFEI